MNYAFNFKNSVVGLNSPFPWAPGHAYAELEFFCYKKLSSESSKQFLFPWPNGPIAEGLQQVMSKSLEEIDVKLITSANSIRQAFLESEPVDASLSSIKYIRRKDIAPSHYRKISGSDIYSSLQDGSDRLERMFISNQGITTDVQDYNRYHIEYNDFFFKVREDISNREVRLNPQLVKYIGDRKLVLINIREHQANGSSGMSASSFEGVVSYCRDNNYAVVDMSHDSKSHNVLKFCKEFNVFPYWCLAEKSALHDIELFSRAYCYLGGGGITHLATLLRVPFIWIGNLYPICVNGYKSLQLPCRLSRKKDNNSLNYSDSFETYLTLPELWEDKYDSWLKKFGHFNPHNCFDTISHYYTIEKPSSYSILLSFIELEDSINNKGTPYNPYVSRFRDLLGRKLQTLDRAKVWDS